MIKSQMISIALWVWAMASIAILIVMQAVSLDLYVVLFAIGFFGIVEIVGPFRSRPAWKKRFNVLMFVVFLAFAVVVVFNMTEVIQQLTPAP